MINHTPGPWFAAGKTTINISCKYGSQLINIAQIKNSGHGVFSSREEREANALLIAAAPEMLDALKNLFVKLESASPELRRMVNYNELEQVIAKAEGVEL